MLCSKISFLVLCLIFQCGTTRAQSINLQLQNDYTVGLANATPRFAVGDLNNDGLPDLVTLNQNNTSTVGPISIFLNNGAGGFGSPINIVQDSLSPNAVAIGDFNRDGNADLIIAGSGISNALHLRLGNGTGNFPTGTFINERGSPAVVTADFNGDGSLDIAVCNNINELRVLNGNGAGGFGAAASFATANTCQDLVSADFNVDGKPDLAVAMRLAPAAQGVQTFINNGTSFNAPLNNTASGATNLAAADFNGDCIPDLAVSQFASVVTGTPIFIMLGSGNGSLTTATTITVNNFPQRMTIGDFNRDKKVDLAIRRNINGNPTANNLTILPGNGAGGFGTAFEASIANATSSTEMHVATMDANRDGKDDLIIGRQGGFLLYHGNSALFTRTENDFDGDLRADLSVFRPSVGDWFIRRSTQGFSQQHWGISTDKLTPADFDGDGKTDIAIWREAPATQAAFWILQSATNTVRLEIFGQTGDIATVVGDWDGDGRADPAVYRGGSQSLFFFRGSLNNPSGNITYLLWGTAGDQSVRGDFDGDGRADAGVFRPSNAVWYILKSSDSQPLYQTWGLVSDRRVPADYDGDGRTDFAVFRPSENIWYVLNSATGTISYRHWGTSGDTLVPADYNGDGRTETAVYRPTEQRWYVPQCGISNAVNTKFGTSGDVAVPAAP